MLTERIVIHTDAVECFKCGAKAKIIEVDYAGQPLVPPVRGACRRHADDLDLG